MATKNGGGSTEGIQIPIQPVEQPILCNPYEEPTAHWVYDTVTGEATKVQGRRPASYWYKTQRTEGQLRLAGVGWTEEQRDKLHLVNKLRQDISRWRASNYEGATQITKELLRHWSREDRPRRLFFCQREAAETVIYLAEILSAGRKPRFSPAFTERDLAQLVDLPNESGLKPLVRFGCKMATGRPEPKYFRLWQNINESLEPGHRLPGKARKPKPEVVWERAQPALNTLASQWLERYQYLQQASDAQDKTPPVLIIVCDNTDIAELFYKNISGEQTIEVVENGEEDEGEDTSTGRSGKAKTRTVYGPGKLFPEYFSNTATERRTLRIDSRLLAEAESGRPDGTRQEAAQQLRRLVATGVLPEHPSADHRLRDSQADGRSNGEVATGASLATRPTSTGWSGAWSPPSSRTIPRGRRR